jgi:hypothetical protein
MKITRPQFLLALFAPMLLPFNFTDPNPLQTAINNGRTVRNGRFVIHETLDTRGHTGFLIEGCTIVAGPNLVGPMVEVDKTSGGAFFNCVFDGANRYSSSGVYFS